jgi:UDP-N-acetylmuramate--alanine ligase
VVERSYSEVLAEVMASRQGIAVAGKRQGRVAAAMIGWTLAQAGLDPTVVLRGTASQFGGPGLAGQGSHAVVDVTAALDAAILCETPPAIALMLDLQSLNESESKILLELVSRVSESGYLVAGADHAIFGMEPFAANPAVESLSLERGSAWWGADLREERGRFRFRAFHKGNFASEIKLQVPGRSSVISALAALAVCSRIEVPTLTIKEALEDFEGVSRGFESRGSYRGVTLLDDDSAGAIEVAEALALVRSVHGRRRLWTVFAPGGRACSATSAALSATDHLILVDGGIDSGDWECMLEEAGVHAHRVENLDEAVLDLDRHLEPGDVLLTLGAGEVGTIADAFIRRLSRDRQGR